MHFGETKNTSKTAGEAQRRSTKVLRETETERQRDRDRQTDRHRD